MGKKVGNWPIQRPVRHIGAQIAIHVLQLYYPNLMGRRERAWRVTGSVKVPFIHLFDGGFLETIGSDGRTFGDGTSRYIDSNFY